MSNGVNCDQSADSTDHRETLKLLVKKLRQAAEIEQQFMCMYLYGAFSIQKRYVNDQKPDPTNAQLEISRRWASTVYLVARQEMEHLSLANNLLRSIGAAPFFARANLKEDPLQEFFLGATPSPAGMVATGLAKGLAGASPSPCCDDLVPIPFEFAFTSFDLDAAKRWTCMEAPHCEVLVENDGEHFADWCFAKKSTRPTAATPDPVQPGTIEDLYDEVSALFEKLPDSAFVTSADSQVSIEQQYDIFVFPVTDHASAIQAIDLITKQGEGIDASPTYQSHYRRFFDIVREWQSKDSFPAFWQLVENPVSSEIQVDFTQRLFDLFDEAYETLLIMLTGLYATVNQTPVSYPYSAPALLQESFAPYMTMVIRSLAEVLVQLRATDNVGGAQRVGPGFNISPDLDLDLRNPYEDAKHGMAGQALKPRFSDIDGITERVDQFSLKLKILLDSGGPPPVIDDALGDWALQRLTYIQTNSSRIAVNLRRIYQQGVFKNIKTVGF